MADGLDLTHKGNFSRAVEDFAARLSATVRGSLGNHVAAFEATISPGKDGAWAGFIRQADDCQGIVLHRAGSPILTLEVRARLTADHAGTNLRVEQSVFRVTPYETTVPLFRYEYDRKKEAGPFPAAHAQFHGRHEALESVLRSAGRSSTRSSRKGHHSSPNVTDLHFPLGGTRFRPCLEDVLEMLIHEFTIDVVGKRATQKSLKEGRRQWRDIQLRAAVRDDLEAAAQVLRAHGYEVKSPVPAPGRNTDRLSRL